MWPLHQEKCPAYDKTGTLTTRRPTSAGLVVEATLCHNAYSEFGLKAPKAAVKKCATKFIYTGAMMCLVGRSMIERTGVKKHKLMKFTKNLTGANGGRIKLDSAMFLNLNLGNHEGSQLVYVMPQVNCQLFTFTEQKFCFGKKEVDYLGFILTEDSVKPRPDMLKSITRDLTGLRIWYGLTSQVGYFHANPAIIETLRALLNLKEKFQLSEEHSIAFQASRQHNLLLPPESHQPCHRLEQDRHGLPPVPEVVQVPGDDAHLLYYSWKTVYAGSRVTTGAKSRYAPMAEEALGMAWALQKTHHFIMGNEKLTVCVHHKPLLKILGDRELGEIKKNQGSCNSRRRRSGGGSRWCTCRGRTTTWRTP